MVSKLDILSRYYQIYIQDINESYFIYESTLYYLSGTVLSNDMLEHYQNYLLQLQMQGYYIVNNCFGHSSSEGHILYRYEPEVYAIAIIMQQSLQCIPDEYASLKIIKSSWCSIIDDTRIRVSKYAARMNHNEHYVILSYYYQGLAENVISMINEILEYYPDDRLPLGYEHILWEDSYDILFNPHNFIISTRVRDIALAYQQECISINDIEGLIQRRIFSEIEVVYLYIRVIFPSHFFSLVLQEDISKEAMKEKVITMYQQIDIEKERICNLYYCVSKYMYIPPIHWLLT
jgi:hypothetical protein